MGIFIEHSALLKENGIALREIINDAGFVIITYVRGSRDISL